jgi:glycosyltransferase involved in cell wall biosynthesis
VSAAAVTVVIPTRNRRQRLAHAALPSALRQTGVEVEVLVVDDGSTDDTASWVTELGDPRVRALRNPAPRGVAAARNAGIAAATGTWVAFLDDDDHWSPAKLATQVAALQETDAVYSYTGALVVDALGEPSDVLVAPPSAELRDLLLRQNVMPAGSSNVVAATDLLRTLGGFDEELAYLADWDMWIRLALAGRGVASDDALVAYVRHPGQMRLTGKQAIAELDRLRARHASAGFAPDEGRLLSWIASQQRVRGQRLQALRTYLLATTTFHDPRWLTQILATPFDSAGRGLKHRLHRRGPATGAGSRPEWVPAP